MKKRTPRYRLMILTVIMFAAGFFTHAIFFPYAFTDNFAIISSAKSEAMPTPAEGNKALTQVIYVDGKFSPRVVQIKRSYYISIVNMSSGELMWLRSNNKLLTTPRGYGKSEELRTILYTPGVYTVSTILHPDDKLQVIVK